MARNTREKILSASSALFNTYGVVTTTTNHIADNLKISPGNLYFHFSNKEEILRNLFLEMTKETQALWQEAAKKPMAPEEFIPLAMEIFWKYRFFHREMYYLRRKDKDLAALWKRHIAKSVRLLIVLHKEWIKAGRMVRITSRDELQRLSDSVLFIGSAYMNFFESPLKAPTRRSVSQASDHLLKTLSPYLK